MARKAAAGYEYVGGGRDPRTRVLDLNTGESLSRREYLKRIGTPITTYKERATAIRKLGSIPPPNRQELSNQAIREFKRAHPGARVRGDSDDAKMFQTGYDSYRKAVDSFQADRAKEKAMRASGNYSYEELKAFHDRAWAKSQLRRLDGLLKAGIITQKDYETRRASIEKYL